MWQAFLRYLQVDRTFLLLVFVFSYLLVISNRVRAGMMSWYVLTPEGPLASFAAALLIFVLLRFWLNRQAEVAPSGNRYSIYLRSFALGLGAYLLFTNALGLLIAALFGNLARNFNPETLLHSNLSQVVDFVLYAGLYLAYHHSQQAATYWLPPFSLQLLLENALLHNQGSAAQPLRVAVVVRDGRLEISNPLQPNPAAATDLLSGSGTDSVPAG